MSDRCEQCSAWITPGSSTCESCGTPVPGAPPDDADPFAASLGDDLSLAFPEPEAAAQPAGAQSKPRARERPPSGRHVEEPSLDDFSGMDLAGFEPTQKKSEPETARFGPGGAGPLDDSFDDSLGGLPGLDFGPPETMPLPDMGGGVVGGVMDDPLAPPIELAPVELPRVEVASVVPSKSPGPREITDAEVLRLADFGLPPEGFFGAIPYALNVFQRKRVLAAARAAVARRRSGAQKRAAAELAVLGQALLDQQAEVDLSALRSFIEAAERTGAKAAESNADQARAEASATEGRAAITDELGAAQAEVDPFRDQETKLRSQLEVRGHDLKRAQAQLKRVEIQRRNAPGGGDELLDADFEARQAEVSLLEGKVKELQTELGRVRRELATRLGRVAAIEEDRRKAEAGFVGSTGLHKGSARTARDEGEMALAELAEEALRQQLAGGAGESAAKGEKALLDRDERLRDEKLHDRALAAFDNSTYLRGWGLIGTAALLIVVALIVLIVR